MAPKADLWFCLQPQMEAGEKEPPNHAIYAFSAATPVNSRKNGLTKVFRSPCGHFGAAPVAKSLYRRRYKEGRNPRRGILPIVGCLGEAG